MRLGYVVGAIASAAGAAGEVCLGRTVLATDPEAALGEFITALVLTVIAMALLREAFAHQPHRASAQSSFLSPESVQAAGHTMPGKL